LYSVEPTFTVHCGDSLEVLKTLPDESIHCCVTSPPYYALRDYGVSGQIGLEETPETYIARLVGVFREVRRVLRDDGTLWVNIGDSYARGFGGGSPGEKSETNVGSFQNRKLGKVPQGMKAKDLIGIPWMLAFALRADGWYLRSEIIWHKPNPMPESVKDRPTKAHEQVFLFSKSERYFYDADGIREPYTEKRGGIVIGRGIHGSSKARGNDLSAIGGFPQTHEGRNRRSVWTITPKPYREAHFATFPVELPEICIKAGSPEGGLVLDPFSGAGTTGIAAVKNGRSYVGIELNPDYAEMSNRRYQAERDRISIMPRSTSSANIEALFQ
jgi:DNA modification methylase